MRLSVVSGGVSQLIRPAETKLMLPDIFPLRVFSMCLCFFSLLRIFFVVVSYKVEIGLEAEALRDFSANYNLKYV